MENKHQITDCQSGTKKKVRMEGKVNGDFKDENIFFFFNFSSLCFQFEYFRFHILQSFL